MIPVTADLQTDAIECRDFKSLYSLLRITNPQQPNDEKLMNFLNGRLKSGIFPNDYDKIKESHKSINKDNRLRKNGHEPYTKGSKYSRYDAAKRVAEKEILNLIKRNEEE